MPDGLEIVRAGVERVADLEPLYSELHAYQVAVMPRLAALPARTAGEAWTRRRERYEEWLARPGAFLQIAQRAGLPVGYALASTTIGYQSWASAERVGEVHDLVVTEAERGQGVGTALLDAVERALAACGIVTYRLRVIGANDVALRFYEERGMTCISRVMLGHIED